MTMVVVAVATMEWCYLQLCGMLLFSFCCYFLLPWLCSFAIVLHGLGCVLLLFLAFWPWSNSFATTFYGLGWAFLLLFFVALVELFYCCFSKFWSCLSIPIICDHGYAFLLLFCMVLVLLLVVLVVLFYYCFSQPWSCFSIFAFMALICKMDFSKRFHSQGNGFSRRNNVLDIGSIGNGLLCFYFQFRSPYDINNTHQQKSCHLQLVCNELLFTTRSMQLQNWHHIILGLYICVCN